MRNTILRDILIGLFAFTAFTAHSQNVAINTTGAVANTSAILDLNTGNAGNKGFLAPQAALLSITDVATILTPATGLIVYNTNAGMTNGNGVGYYYWNGTDWIIISGSAGDWLLTGNSGSTPATNWIGTNDANALQFKVNGVKAGWLDYLNTAANVFLGYQSGLGNTTGSANTAMGYQAFRANTTGTDNTAIGFGAMLSNTGGTDNTGIGFQSLYNNSIGSNNTALGYIALTTNTTGINNTAIGLEAAQLNSNSNGITALGAYALLNTVGGFNTAIGLQAGQTNAAGQYNSFLGMQADANAGGYINSAAIGSNAYIGASNVMVLGSINSLHGGLADVYVGIGTNVPTQKLQVNNGNILISQGAIGGDAATVGALQLQGTGTGIASIQAGAQGATNYNYILPTTAPAAGDVLDVTAYAAPNVSLGWQVEPNALLKVIVVTVTQAATVFDAGTTYILYKVIGGGGAGGGGINTVASGCTATAGTGANGLDIAAAGGGAGGYTEGFVTGITGGVSTYAVTIGAGGVGQATCNPTLTADGGQTQLLIAGPATTINAPGGSHGATLEYIESAITSYTRTAGGNGGTPINAGAVNIKGAQGGYGSITPNGIHACESGPGANSYFEGGGSQFEERDVQSCSGNPATGYGSGGSGGTYADCATNGATTTGGNGSPGIVIIYEYK